MKLVEACGILDGNAGACIRGIGFWGPLLYYTYNEEPPKNSLGNYLGPYITL